MIKVLELFSGIGACSKALTNLGIEHEIVDSVEIDKYAVQSFNAVHGTNFEPQDIIKWDKDIEADLIMHGSPCQDFSVAGKTIQNDNMAHEEFQNFLNEAMTIIHAYTIPGGGVISWMSDTELTTLKNAFDYAGLNFRTVICWVKSQFTLGGNDFQSAKEMAIYGLGEGKFDESQGDETSDASFACYGRGKGGKFTDSRKLSNVWFFDKPRSNKDHPTMKPIGLCAKGVLAMSEPGDIVFDPFMGSGSTMIACQQTGRRCYGCELDPRYTDVIRKRYVKFTTGSEDNWQELTPEEEL